MLNKKIRNIIYTAVFAALVFVAVRFLGITAGGGYYHIGDAFIYLAGVCLPFPYASAAGAIGGSLANLTVPAAVQFAPFTFVIKACAAACFSNKTPKILCARNFIAIAAASVITVAGYGAAYIILFGRGGLVNSYGDFIQVVLNGVIFITLGVAADKTNLLFSLRKEKSKQKRNETIFK
ncbi:MAG: ECF transporter S component [Oscillospiraceae bacterium]|nr:ECF transporter S component [Oscillospiraceae bacterium]